MFGEDYTKYISNLDFNRLKVDCNNFYLVGERNGYWNFTYRFNQRHTNEGEYILNSKEKHNIISIINSLPYNRGVNSDVFVLLQNVLDHLEMIKKVKAYYPNTELNADTYDSFTTEHSFLSKIIHAIKKGYEIEYLFHEDTINMIEKPIRIGESDEYYYPYILKRESEYVEEGTHMHHCVASYADTENSIIISIRDKNKKERVTCELSKQNARLIQSKSFCNAVPPSEFQDSIEEITDRCILLAKFNKLNHIKKERVPVKINGIEIQQEDREPRKIHDVLRDLDRLDLPF